MAHHLYNYTYVSYKKSLFIMLLLSLNNNLINNSWTVVWILKQLLEFFSDIIENHMQLCKSYAI